MESIASKLKTRRESLNISLEKISNDTRISLHHLISLENGQYSDLPGGMYKRAILRAYCDELGLDKNEILQCYDDEIAPRLEKPIISSSASPASKIKTHTAVVWSLIFLLSVGLFLNREWLVSALSPYFSSDYDRPSDGLQSEQAPVPTKAMNVDATVNPAIESQTLNHPVETSSASSPGNSVNTVEAPPKKQTVQTKLNTDMSASQPLRLEIVGKEECWLSVDRDGSGVVTKTLSPGDVEFFTADRTISLIVGNAGGVSLRINDRAAKTLGRQGQVVHLTIDEDTLPNLIDPPSS